MCDARGPLRGDSRRVPGVRGLPAARPVRRGGGPMCGPGRRGRRLPASPGHGPDHPLPGRRPMPGPGGHVYRAAAEGLWAIRGVPCRGTLHSPRRAVRLGEGPGLPRLGRLPSIRPMHPPWGGVLPPGTVRSRLPPPRGRVGRRAVPRLRTVPRTGRRLRGAGRLRLRCVSALRAGGTLHGERVGMPAVGLAPVTRGSAFGAIGPSLGTRGPAWTDGKEGG